MPAITFKAKPVDYLSATGLPVGKLVQIPKLTRRHCDMHAFRTSREFGPYANSDFFESVLKRAVLMKGIGPTIRIDQPLPDGVTIDATGFLAVVTINL